MAIFCNIQKESTLSPVLRLHGGLEKRIKSYTTDKNKCKRKLKLVVLKYYEVDEKWQNQSTSLSVLLINMVLECSRLVALTDITVSSVG